MLPFLQKIMQLKKEFQLLPCWLECSSIWPELEIVLGIKMCGCALTEITTFHDILDLILILAGSRISFFAQMCQHIIREPFLILSLDYCGADMQNEPYQFLLWCYSSNVLKCFAEWLRYLRDSIIIHLA